MSDSAAVLTTSSDASYCDPEVERVALNALDFVHVKKRLEGKPLHHKTSSSIPELSALPSPRSCNQQLP